jgi:hypothetical protein
MTGHDEAEGRYGSLAAAARQAGYQSVTTRQVHVWCGHGLLPAAVIGHTGFGKREIREPAGTDTQLKALCRARFDLGIRNHELLATWLWAEGFDISVAKARKGLDRLLQTLPAYLDRYRRGQGAEDGLDDLALEAARTIALQAGRPRDVALLHRGLFEAASRHTHIGSEAEPDLEGLRHLGQLIGLDRAQTDRIGEAEPWLSDEPGVAMLQGLEGTSIDRLSSALAASSDDQLDHARVQALELRKRWSILGEMIELGWGPDFAGLAVVRRGFEMPLGLPLVALLMLSLREQAETFLVALPAGEELAAMADAIRRLKEAMAADQTLAYQVATNGAIAALGVDQMDR